MLARFTGLAITMTLAANVLSDVKVSYPYSQLAVASHSF